MPGKAVVSLSTGLEDTEKVTVEKVTVAFLVAVGAAESGRPTLMFLTKEAVRLALDGVPSRLPAMAARRSRRCWSATRRPADATTSARSVSTPRSSTRPA